MTVKGGSEKKLSINFCLINDGNGVDLVIKMMQDRRIGFLKTP